MYRSLLASVLLTGCPWIDADELAARNDLDGDGVSGILDCDDGDAAVGLATSWYPDDDGDGFGEGDATSACEAPPDHVAVPGDCSPLPDRHPGAPEQCNGVDDDCDGRADEVEDVPLEALTAFYTDADGDGWGTVDDPPVYDCAAPPDRVEATAVFDCDDDDRDVSPGEAERCATGVDEDCDGAVDEEGDAFAVVSDADGDGYASSDEVLLACQLPAGFVLEGEASTDPLDCNDAAPDVNPGAPDPFYDGIDADCDGANDFDQDGDGLPGDGDSSLATPGEDCDDDNPASAQARSPEIPYDGVDQDCDGADLTDVDGDGVDGSLDCNDFDPLVRPGGVERCNNLDDDCNGATDEVGQAGDGDAVASLPDLDDDGAAPDLQAAPTWICGDRADWVPELLAQVAGEDCDDYDDSRRPGRYDVPYDGIDQDCDGVDTTDVDGDTFEPPLDCDDNDPLVSPDAGEVCGNGRDDDCDGVADDEAAGQPIAFLDADGDGAPADRVPRRWCVVPAGYVLASVALGDDCDDGDASVAPDLDEVPYDGVDQDCDGVDLTDVDGDTVDFPLDCDDLDAAVRPGQPEVCDGLDNDCDGAADVGALDSEDYVTDADGDTWPATFAVTAWCPGDEPDAAILAASASAGVDCDDLDPVAYPGAPELWYNGIDEDCLGGDDDDQDGDGVGRADDCDDTDPARAPDPLGELLCGDGVDNDCDGRPDFRAQFGDTFQVDDDLDTFPDPTVTATLCGDHPGWVRASANVTPDCDDQDPATFPGAPDLAVDLVDRDCDSLDSDRDGDGDGDPGDCDGDDPTVFHGAVELCDEIDQDCNGASGEELVIASAVSGGVVYDVTAAVGTLDLQGVDELRLCGDTDRTVSWTAGTNDTTILAFKGKLTGAPLLVSAPGAGDVTLVGGLVVDNGVGAAIAELDGGSLVFDGVEVAGLRGQLALVGPGAALDVVGGAWLDNATALVSCDDCVRVSLTGLEAKRNAGRLVLLTGVAGRPVFTVDDLTYVDGGGLFSAVSADVDLRTSAIEGAVWSAGGVGDLDDAELRVDDASFTANQATGDGGVFYAVSSDLDLSRTLFDRNRAERGGAVFLSGGSLLEQKSDYLMNQATADGGAVFASNASLVVNSVGYEFGIAKAGAAVYLLDTTMTASGLFASDNVATTTGGALAVDGSVLVMTGGSLDRNEATLGGGIWFSTPDLTSAVLGAKLEFNGQVGGDVNAFVLGAASKKTLVCLGSTGTCL